jgi:hypothetical protein
MPTNGTTVAADAISWIRCALVVARRTGASSCCSASASNLARLLTTDDFSDWSGSTSSVACTAVIHPPEGT